jgi:DegV family protein with EDD domain
MHFGLSGSLWYSAVCHGAHTVIQNYEELNKINVFPVADADTGNNLVSLLQSILNHAIPDATFAKTAESIAHSAILGSRGNSGAIFSQFLCGFIPEESVSEKISLKKFSELSLKASKSAYQSVDIPQDGTILSVMQDWAMSCVNGVSKKGEDWLGVLNESYSSAQASLQKTTEQLAVLRGTQLVDAGAKGFVYFLEGILQYLELPEELRAKKSIEPSKKTVVHVDSHTIPNTKPELRYCSEALLSDLQRPLADIKPALRTWCDSIVIAGNKTDARIHFHTNEPQKAMPLLEEYGSIQHTKVEDMLHQYLSQSVSKPKICLVIDSTADLPQHIIDEHLIHVLPIQIQIDNHHYLDRYSISTDAVYQKLRSNEHKISTSMPDILTTEQSLQRLSQQYEHIIAITIAAKQSGTYQLIKQASERLNIKNITVIDSLRNSSAHGLLVKCAADLIREGLTPPEIIEKIENLRLKSNIMVAVHDIKYMQRSGRLSNTKANIIKILNLNPVVALNSEGVGYVLAKSFGFNNALNTIVKKIVSLSPKLKEYAIVHADAEDHAKKLGLELSEKLGKEPVYIMSVSAAIGLHAGPGCVAVAILEDDDMTTFS